MSGGGNPFVVEGMRLYFSERRILRSYLFLAAGLGLVLAAAWPRGTIEAALREGAAADTFTLVAGSLLLLLFVLCARFGVEDFTPAAADRLREYAALTPVSLFAVIVGRAAFAALHTGILLLIGAPYLAAAMAAGGAGPGHALSALAAVGAAGMFARMSGLLALTLLRHRQARGFLLLGWLAAVFVLTLFIAPGANPVHAISLLLVDRRGSSGCLLCAAADMGAACMLAACAGLALGVLRARAKRRGVRGG